MFDFGNYVVADKFIEHPVYSFEGDRVLITPGFDFVQPDPRISLPASVWGPYRDGHIESREDKPAIWSHDTAKYIEKMFNQGRFEEGRNATENLFKTLLKPIHEKLMVPLPFEIEHNKFIKWKKPERYCSAIFFHTI